MIADHFGVSNEQIEVDYKAVLKDCTKHRDRVTKVLIARKLEEYAEVKREAWEQWERSKGPCESIRVESTTQPIKCDDCGGTGKIGLVKKNRCLGCKGTGKIEAPVKTTHTTIGRLGDSNYLRVIIDCLKAERDLMGLNPSLKMKVKGEHRIDGNISWDMIMQGIPDGPVPDVVENALHQASQLTFIPAEPIEVKAEVNIPSFSQKES
jgi:hypothetical protein